MPRSEAPTEWEARVRLDEVLADLWVESAELDTVVAGLAAAGPGGAGTERSWASPTPAEGWTVAHQIAHLAWTDEAARLAATDQAGFQELLERAARNPSGFVDEAAAEGAALPPDQLLPYWRETRTELAEALRQVPDGERVAWFGPPMSPVSMATARLMETWAHGQDIVDGLGITRRPSKRLRHVAHLAVRARDFSYLLNHREPPTEPFRVELAGPDGEVWSWGPSEAGQRVSGPALDFCLLATQRRHRLDLAVEAKGEDAEEWLGIIQAFAGAPGPGRAPGQFS